MSSGYTPSSVNKSSAIASVHVKTSARLHMGFFDLNGELGRRFGSLGVSLDKPCTALAAFPADTISAEGPGAERAVKTARRIADALHLPSGMHIVLSEAIPEHAGLGSGTQMSLAVGTAISRLYSLNLSLRDIAVLTARGARSGIGLGTFATGGVIVDGGRSSETDVPPVIAHADFPDPWRILLIFDHARTGVHGSQEIEAFRVLPTFPAQSAAELCRYVLMQALPALVEHDLPAFGRAIRELQERTGDHFAPAQGGRYASPRVAEILQFLAGQGTMCLGQSSWGPTGFAVFADVEGAERMLEALQSRYTDQQGIEFLLCKGGNAGAEISVIQQDAA
ncbi:MAG TPA: beta-ribofuranosylaminobenzene 5'-phosphate synthase family protein [Methylovorus sp.]|nr:beta-ribofuranosylaminobenzene 5'-phosphate synthase family protein [Methylovorus sp.]